MEDENADDMMDDREDEGDAMGIDEENADSMAEDEDAMEEEDTSDIEMIDTVVIMEHPEESSPENVSDTSEMTGCKIGTHR